MTTVQSKIFETRAFHRHLCFVIIPIFLYDQIIIHQKTSAAKTEIMKRTLFCNISCIAPLIFGLGACREDVGPYQSHKKTYVLTSFDRLNMGSAFSITVQAGPVLSVVAEGDRRNLDDLEVYVVNGTLVARYRTDRNRQHQTSLSITMPTVRGVDFSGASQSTITGFTTNISELSIELSGVSKAEFTREATRITTDASVSSTLQLNGRGMAPSAKLSGTSYLQSFSYPVSEAGIDASGSSKASVSVNNVFVANTSGASTVRYGRTPTVQQCVSGNSTVQSE